MKQLIYVNSIVGVLFMLGAVCLPRQAEAQWLIEGGLQQQRWLEDKGAFVEEDGVVPRLAVQYRTAEARSGWSAQVAATAGEVAYRGINQASRAIVYSHSRYRGGELSLQGWHPVTSQWGVTGGIEARRWRRDIYNPLLARDQSEIYRLLLWQAGVVWQPQPGLMLTAAVNQPFAVRVDALLGDFGFERSPQLRPRGLPAPQLAVSWQPQPGYRLHLQWARWRFSASAPQAVGNSQVLQPASQFDIWQFGVAKEF